MGLISALHTQTSWNNIQTLGAAGCIAIPWKKMRLWGRVWCCWAGRQKQDWAGSQRLGFRS